MYFHQPCFFNVSLVPSRLSVSLPIQIGTCVAASPPLTYVLNTAMILLSYLGFFPSFHSAGLLPGKRNQEGGRTLREQDIAGAKCAFLEHVLTYSPQGQDLS